MNTDDLRKLATDLTTETLHGQIPTKTTMKLAEGILELTDPSNETRGLVIISALINFADYLDSQEIVTGISKETRAKWVREFLENMSHETNYFQCADDIAKRLGEPFAGKL